MTPDETLFPAGNGDATLDDYPFAFRYAPGQAARFVFANRDSHLPTRRARDELFSLWEPLPLLHLDRTVWFPAVINEAQGPIEGLLIGVRFGEALPGGVPLPDRLKRSAIQWVKHWLCVERIPGEDKLRASLTPGASGFPVDDLDSAGLASAVALLMLLSQEHATPVVVCSGELGDRGGGLPIGFATHKRSIAEAEILAAGVRVEPWIADDAVKAARVTQWIEDTLGDGARRRLLAACDYSPEAVLRSAHQALFLGDKIRAGALARSVTESVDGRYRALALWISASAATRRGNAGDALMLVNDARDAWSQATPTKDFDAYAFERMESITGVALLDNAQPTTAAVVLQSTLTELTSVPERFRDNDWADAVTRVTGTLRRVLIMLGRANDAVELHREWALGLARVPSQQARCWMDLGLTLFAAGDVEQAKEAIATSRSHVCEIDGGDRSESLRYIELAEWRLGLGNKPIADPNLNVGADTFVTDLMRHIQAHAAGPSYEPILKRMVIWGVHSSTPLQMLVARGLGDHMMVGGESTISEDGRRLIGWLLDTVTQKEAPAYRDALLAVLDGDPVPLRKVSPY